MTSKSVSRTVSGALLATAVLAFVSPDANASSATHGVQRHQVGDFLNSVRRAINRGSKRRGRRARGSDTPILDKPPTLPVRSAARASGSVEALPEVVSRSLRPAREEAQPAKGLPTPSTKTTLALPPRRPKQIPLPSRRAKVTAAVAVAGKTAAAAATPPPKVWSAEQIRTAYDQCDALLAKLPVTVTPVKPIRKGACGTPGPVALSELGESTRISVRPAATLNCRTVKAVHRWFAKHVQPAASEVLGTQVVGIRNVSSYSCRNRNNAKTGRLSEHAYGNALDIAAFKLADGRTISLLGDWGPVARDQKKDEAVETLSARSKPTRRKTPKPIANADLRTAAVATSLVASASITDTSDIPLPAFKGPVRRGVRLKPYLDAGAPKPIAVPATPPREYTRQAEATEPAALPPESVFLRRIHSEACEVFGTVLGPEANDAHRDHFHVDMAKRRYRAYCR